MGWAQLIIGPKRAGPNRTATTSEPTFPDFTRKFTLSVTVMWVILSKMEEIDNNIDPENQVSYGRSTWGNEVMMWLLIMMSDYSSVDGLMRHGVTVDNDDWL